MTNVFIKKIDNIFLITNVYHACFYHTTLAPCHDHMEELGMEKYATEKVWENANEKVCKWNSMRMKKYARVSMIFSPWQLEYGKFLEGLLEKYANEKGYWMEKYATGKVCNCKKYATGSMISERKFLTGDILWVLGRIPGVELTTSYWRTSSVT